MNSTRRLRYLIDIIVIALAYFGLDAAADALPLRDFRIVIVVSTLAKCVFLVFIWFWLLMRGDTVGTIGLKKPRNWLFSILAGRGGPCSFAELGQRFYVIPSKQYLLLSIKPNVAPQMRTLAARIRRELRNSALPIPYCAIYEEELQRFFPSELQNREAEVEKFAKQHGFKLRFYKRGLCAIFQENPQNHPAR